MKIKGFTFVEILAAMLFMAIVIPVTVQGVGIASRLAVKAGRKRQALELASLKLNEILIEDLWRDGEDAGDFNDLNENHFSRYSWILEIQEWEQDQSMRLLTVTVFYDVQERESFVRLCTIVSSEVETEE